MDSVKIGLDSSEKTEGLCPEKSPTCPNCRQDATETRTNKKGFAKAQFGLYSAQSVYKRKKKSNMTLTTWCVRVIIVPLKSDV